MINCRLNFCYNTKTTPGKHGHWLRLFMGQFIATVLGGQPAFRFPHLSIALQISPFAKPWHGEIGAEIALTAPCTFDNLSEDGLIVLPLTGRALTHAVPLIICP